MSGQQIIEYERPYLYPMQEGVFFNDARYVYCEASTKSGKTHGCIVWIVEGAVLEGFHGWNGWWVAPTTAQAKIAMVRIKNALPRSMYKSNESERYIEFPNGARVWFKSAEKPDNLYGEDVYRAVLDEASRARHDSFLALRSTLTATGGPIRLIANVKGKSNWFYLMCRNVQRKQAVAKSEGRATSALYFKITAYDAVDAGVLELAEVEDAKANLTAQDFSELFMAEAVDDDDAFIPSSYVEEAIARTCDPFGPLIIGADPSQGRHDPAAFAFKRGFNILEVTEHAGMDEFGFIGHAMRLIEEGYHGIKPVRMNIDATGFGAMIVKTLHEKGEKYQRIVRGFHMQQRSTYPQEYANKRAECWGEMKKAFTSTKDLFDLPDDEGLMIELTCIRKKADSAGRLLMEDKDDLKARGYESPNKADACSLLFAEPMTFYTEENIDYPLAMKRRVLS
jgi:hypothetical protein